MTKLENPDLYNTEVVFLADRLDKYTDEAIVEINSPEGYGFKTQFSTKDFKYGNTLDYVHTRTASIFLYNSRNM